CARCFDYYGSSYFDYW
nr:immunoglobulin heavy chain junction region [Mus musculus]MBK4186459.1 immunoglobulin heavy chain junction region [Mus musculus]